MKKFFSVMSMVVFMLVIFCTTVWAGSTVLKSDLLPSDSNYVAEARLIVSVGGTSAQTGETKTWTLFEFWFTSGCFRDGQRTIEVTSLAAKKGFQWTRDDSWYCIVRE